MNDLEILTSTRDLLTPDNAWTSHSYMRDGAGDITTLNKKAVSFCLIGALSHTARCQPNDVPVSIVQALDNCLTERALHVGTGHTRMSRLMLYNDASTTRHEDIMKLIDCAIEKLRNEVTTPPTRPLTPGELG